MSGLQFGLVRGEPIQAYHDADAVSKSKLTDFRKSKLLYFKKYVERSIPREAMKREFLVGQGAHVLTLEGLGAYYEAFAIAPDDAPADLRRFRDAKKPSEDTLKSIAYWDEFDRNTAGKMRITAADERHHRSIRDAARSHEIIDALLSEGEAEVTFRVQADRYAIQCRPDWLNFGASPDLSRRLNALGVRVAPGEPYCFDLKTVASLSDLDFTNFQKNFENLGYHRQGPFYRGVIKSAIDLSIEKFFFGAVDLFQSAVYLPDDKANETGWSEVSADLKALGECYDSGLWPGVSQSLQTITLSRRYLRKEGYDAAA